MEKIFENSFGKAFYDRENAVVHESYGGIVNPNMAIEVVKSVVDFAAENQVKGDVIDLTNVSGTFTGINEYLSKEFFPVMVERGCVAFGMIVSNNVFTEYAANSLVEQLGIPQLQLFNSLLEGTDWVSKQVEKLKACQGSD